MPFNEVYVVARGGADPVQWLGRIATELFPNSAPNAQPPPRHPWPRTLDRVRDAGESHGETGDLGT